MYRWVIAALVGLGAGAFAADLPAPGTPLSAPPVSDWAANETIVVAAKAEGPAFWHIAKGDSEIYILGTVGDIPNGTQFEEAHILAVFKGARVVLLPPQASNGFFSVMWFFLTHRGLLSLPEGKTLFETLPPDLRTRFIALLDTLKAPKDKFNDDPPVIAAVRLESGFAAQAKLIKGGATETIEKLADQVDAPVERIADYDALGLVKELLRLPQDKQQACLSEAVSNAELRMVHITPLARAWATGDVKAIKAHYTPRLFAECAKATTSFNKLYEQAVADYLKAIHAALAKPGKTVLITDVGPLLRHTGVVATLHGEGLTIEGPPD